MKRELSELLRRHLWLIFRVLKFYFGLKITKNDFHTVRSKNIILIQVKMFSLFVISNLSKQNVNAAGIDVFIYIDSLS